jgi:hypothetical protein
MYSQTQFAPGKKSNSSRVIKYIAAYNALYPNSQPLDCICIPDKYNKLVVSSDASASRVSNKIRISKIVNSTKGGNTQYGNFYLGEPLDINCFGRSQGMPGGSGAPPLNRF